MKINIILPAIGHSGGIDVIYKYVSLWIRKGYDVIVYKEIKAPNMHRYKSEIVNKVHQIYCSMKAIKASKSPKLYDEFVWYCNNNSVRDADVIIATSWTTAYVVDLLHASKGKKYYFIQDFEVWDNEQLGKGSYMLPLNKIVISSWINNRMVKELGIGPFPMIMNGIDSFFSCVEKKQKEKNTVQFLMLNHRLEKKGVNYGIQAYEKIHDIYLNTHLKMFGMCSNENLPDYVEYVQNPSKEELVKMYRESDIFIFPSLDEGWGLTPLEAMACGCVVVGTKTGFVLDLGIHNENMMISNPGDIEEMANNIKKILESSELFMKLKKNGQMLTDKLNWKDSCDLFTSILEGKNKNDV